MAKHTPPIAQPTASDSACCAPSCCDGDTPPIATPSDELASTVREKYGAAARRVLEAAASGSETGTPAPPTSSCCGASPFDGRTDPISSNLYATGEASALPAAALLASLGCGNPTALAELRAGDVVLDLGSGGGIDVLLSARRVGPTGRAYGLDMTDDMLDLARRNAAPAGVGNVEFLRGRIEEIPLLRARLPQEPATAGGTVI